MDSSFKYVIIVNLIVGITTKENNCLNLNTNGFTVPRGDIVLSYGQDLTITCNIDHDMIDQYGPNATSRMYFKRGNDRIPREMIEVLNSTSIRLHVEKHPMVESDTYYCYIEGNKTDLVCFNTVIVGVAPQNITDFSCISRNYENLTCTWTPPKNYVVTHYTLNYSLKIRPSRFIYSCPKIETLENGQQRCFWDSSTNPQYRPVHKCYYFLFHINNTFGSIKNYFTFEHFKYVRPNPPENLTAVATSPHSINLSWKIPSTMYTFIPGLHHRILYQCEFYEKVWQFGGLLTKNVKNTTLSYTLDGLKYAHSICDIRVSMRSAEAEDEYMWSENATLTVRTESKIPDCPPKTNIGSFEIINIGLNRDVYVYWQQIREDQTNGQNFTYQIEVQNHPEMYPAELTRAYATFKNLSFTDYVINIWSVNEIGRSKEKSTVVVPANRLDEPMNFIKVAKDNSFELSWTPPKKSKELVTNYTIFWCGNERDRPFPCLGNLSWTTVPSDASSHIQPLIGNDVYQFAISANSWNTSSGMSWAECTIIPNRSMGKIKNAWITTLGSDFINVGWKLDCSNRVGKIEQFIIFYCPVESISERSCRNSTERNITVGGSEQSATVTHLQPYTTYRLTVGYRFNANTYSQTSDPLSNTTLEAAPDTPPLNVEVYDVTNSSVTLKWDPPKKTNGILKYYLISHKDIKDPIKVDRHVLWKTLSNLQSFENYVISIQACTVACSKESAYVNVTTKKGFPNKISKPSITSQNDTYMTISWDKPDPPRGDVNYYQIKMAEQHDPDQDSIELKNVTSQNYVIESCATGKQKTLFVWVRAVNIIDGQHKAGEWSDFLESSCPSYIFMVYMIMGSLGVVIIIGATCGFRKVYAYLKQAHNCVPKLPPGLEPDLWSTEKSKDIDLTPPADAQSLLPPLSETHIGGDSSGCSSCQESITSSLESTAHISPSDSGTEQPRSPSLNESRKTCRLRSVATTRPTGYVTVDTINTSNWPSKPPTTPAGNYCVLGVGLEPPKKLKADSPYIPISDLKNTKLPLNFSSDLSQPPPPYVMTGEIVKNLNPVNPGYVPYTIPETTDKNLGLYELMSSNN